MHKPVGCHKGVDIRHLEAVQEFVDQHGLPWKLQAVMNVLLLQDEGQLQFKERCYHYHTHKLKSYLMLGLKQLYAIDFTFKYSF